MNAVDARTVVGIVGYRCEPLIARLIQGSDAWTHRDFAIHVCENGGAAAYSSLLAAVEDGGATLRDDPPRPVSPRVLASRHYRTRTGRDLVIHHASGNLGYSGGVNTILHSIAGDPTWSAFWLLNPDAQPERDALEALLSHQRQGGYGIVGARLVYAGTGRMQQYGGRWRWWLGRGYNVGLGAPADLRPDVPAVEDGLDYASGACMLVSRYFVQSVGAMDERYFLYSEEVDWCLRRGSLSIGYAHAAVVHHDQGATIGSNASLSRRSALSVYLLERSGLLLTRKFRPALLPLVALTAGAFTLKYLRAGGPSLFATALAGWAAGLRGESGFPARFRP